MVDWEHLPPVYVVFDDCFTTVDSSEESIDDSIDSTKWIALFMNERFSVEFDGDDPIKLKDE